MANGIGPLMFFKNREEAGKWLGQQFKQYRNKNVVVLALPRGGVVVAAEIAKILGAPLSLIFAHKISHPYQPEYAVAAVSESGELVYSAFEPEFIDSDWVLREKARQMSEIKQRRNLYLKGQKAPSLTGKIAIIVDDGIATGLTMQAGVKELKKQHPQKIIVAVPVAPKSTVRILRDMGTEFVGNEIEDINFLGAVGAYYRQFGQVEDEEVVRILNGK